MKNTTYICNQVRASPGLNKSSPPPLDKFIQRKCPLPTLRRPCIICMHYANVNYNKCMILQSKKC